MVRLGIVGCGQIAKRHLDACGLLKTVGIDTFSIESVCDTATGLANWYADEAEKIMGKKPTVFGGLTGMLKFSDVDAVLICLPHGYHHTTAIEALDKGRHVLVEKPIGITVQAGQMILDKTIESGKVLAVAENCRRMIGPRAVRWAFERKGLVGTPRMFFAQTGEFESSWFTGAWSWRNDRLLSGGGLLLDAGIHMVDALRCIFGEICSVFASVNQFDDRWSTPPGRSEPPVRSSVEDTWTSIIDFVNGAVGTWSWTAAAPCAEMFDMSFYGSEGRIGYDGTCAYPYVVKDVFHPFMVRNRGSVELVGGKTFGMAELCDMFLDSLSGSERDYLFPCGIEDNGYALEIHDFVESVRGNRLPEVDAQEGLRSLAACMAFYESNWYGDNVSVDNVYCGSITGYQNAINEHWGIGS